MGLSLSVLVALCFFMPGAAFVIGISRLHSSSRPPSSIEQHVSLGLVVAILAALFFHGIWLASFQLLLSTFQAPVPSVEQFASLLVGGVATEHGSEAVKSLQKYPLRITAYWLSVTLIAWHLGKTINKKIARNTDASWFELLKPSDADFVWLTAETHMDGSCFLFAGVVREFCVGKTGDLERVVLGFAVKRQLNPPLAQVGGTLIGNWTEIPGEFVVLQMRGSNTINIDYFYEDDELADSPDVAQTGSVLGTPC